MNMLHLLLFKLGFLLLRQDYLHFVGLLDLLKVSDLFVDVEGLALGNTRVSGGGYFQFRLLTVQIADRLLAVFFKHVTELILNHLLVLLLKSHHN